MKPIWKGYISFGLVNIPIKLVSAVESKSGRFRMLDKKDKTPIKYIRWNPKQEREVPWHDVVKGFEVSKNRYIVIEKEDLDKLKPEKTDSIDIHEFVDAQQVDQIFFDKHYYAVPEKDKEKTYFLFKEVLQQTAKVAIGKFVMREKEYLCAVESYKGGLLLTTLNYNFEIRDISVVDELKNPPKLEKKELDLAKQLIDKLYEQKFDISKFKDTFSEELDRMLEKRSKGEIITVEDKGRRIEARGQNLLDALKASLK